MLSSEARLVQLLPENAHKLMVLVSEVDGGYQTEIEGRTYRASNPFLLDSLLSDAGVPMPRNLFLIEEGVNGE